MGIYFYDNGVFQPEPCYFRRWVNISRTVRWSLLILGPAHHAFVILTGMEHGARGKQWLSAAPLVLVVAADFVYFVVAGAPILPLPNPMLIPLGVVLAAAAAVMIPNPVVRTGAAVVIGIAVFLGALSIGMLYVPAAIAAALVAQSTPRGERSPEPKSSGPKKGIIYTESELEQFRRRGP